MLFNVKSDEFRSAVRKIERRAERQLLEEKLVHLFVPNRVLEELNTHQNQLLFGRRGVGKTHTLKKFLSHLVLGGDLCHYVDCTSFGSALGNEGSDLNVAVRFFTKFMLSVRDALLDDFSSMENPGQEDHAWAQTLLEQLSEYCAAGSVSKIFPYDDISKCINKMLAILRVENITFLIDEWAHIPSRSQPYFAEYLKRSFFSNPRCTIKIAVVDYTYNLAGIHNENRIGLEKSADIFSDIRMDSFFVWDRDEDFVENFFAEVLYNHLATELGVPSDLPDKHNQVTSSLFTQRKAFSELCRASEGNARDFLVIFGRAHEIFRQSNEHDKISIDNVLKASIEWYRLDKYSNIATESNLENFMEYLVRDVIRDRRSRTFMIPHRSINHPLLERLFSARLLHPLNIEWSHPHKPGERYQLITIDYGAYASFKGTKFEPQKVFWETGDTTEQDIVPLDDRKSIRHIVVDKSALNSFQAS